MGARPTILYVDDQPSHQVLFQKAFQANYEIVVASSGQEALDILQGKNIFLVIADHNMPGMTGIDFLEKAEKILPKAQRAILSAYLDDGIVKEAQRRVILAGHLPKPWKLDGMRGFIEKAYEKYAVSISEPSLEQEKTPLDVPSSDLIPHEKPVTSNQLAQVVDILSESVNRQGARRIFLKFVEPRLKETFPLIRRPYPEALRDAQKEALKGNFDGVQKCLSNYLSQQGIEKIMEELTTTPKKILN